MSVKDLLNHSSWLAEAKKLIDVLMRRAFPGSVEGCDPWASAGADMALIETVGEAHIDDLDFGGPLILETESPGGPSG